MDRPANSSNRGVRWAMIAKRLNDASSSYTGASDGGEALSREVGRILAVEAVALGAAVELPGIPAPPPGLGRKPRRNADA